MTLLHDTTIGQNHESFMGLFLDVYENERRRIKWAYILSKDAHRSFSRKTGDRYFEHPRQVALILATELGIRISSVICAALLHDVVEDTRYLDVTDIKMMFGGHTGMLVDAVTKRENEGSKYYQRLKEEDDPYVLLLKGADTLANLRTLRGNDVVFIRKQLAKAEGYVIPLLALLVVRTYGGHLHEAAEKLYELVQKQVVLIRSNVGYGSISDYQP